MARKLWTAAEMEKLSRREQQAIFDERVVTDLSEVPPAFLARVRADAEPPASAVIIRRLATSTPIVTASSDTSTARPPSISTPVNR